MTGPPAALAEVEAALPDLLADVDVLGPVPSGEGVERLVLRVPRTRSAELAHALQQLQSVRSARKAEPVRVEVDPRELA